MLKDFSESGPNVVWEVERGSGHASPTVSGDYLVFIHELDGLEMIECLHPESGKRYWKHEYAVTLGSSYGVADAPRAAPTIAGDFVYSMGALGDLICFDLATGAVVWQRNMEDSFGAAPLFFGRGGSPLVYGDTLVVNAGGNACIVGLDKRTGEKKWETPHDWHASYASPVPASLNGMDRVLVFAGGMLNPPAGGLISVDPVDGSIRSATPWRATQFASVNAASPVVAGDSVFITEGYTEGGALVDFSPGGEASIRWTAPRFRGQFTTPIAHDGYLYGVSGTAGTEIVCYELESGREMWRDSVDMGDARLGRASALWADGAFLCIGDQGTLLWLDLAPSGIRIISQAQLFHAPETWGVPALSRGLLYVNRNAMGSRLICYDLRAD